MSSQVANWVFTLFNLEEMKSLEDLGASYLVYQLEVCPESGRDHYQGYVQFPRSKALSGCKKLFPTAHWEPRKKAHEAARLYCMKESTRKPGTDSGPFEFGTGVVKGSRTRKVREQCERSPERMKLEESSLYRKWYSGETEEVFSKRFKFDFELKDWQKQLSEMIVKPADSRTIIWVYGPNGNEGKSTFAKKLKADGWYYTRGGKSENLFYSYGPNIEKNIVFDIPRSTADYLNYAAVEAIKDGIFESSKYEPLPFSRVTNVHVVIMANFLPEFEKTKKEFNYETKSYDVVKLPNTCLSRDRVVVIKCADKHYLDAMPILRPQRLYKDCPINRAEKHDGGYQIFYKDRNGGDKTTWLPASFYEERIEGDSRGDSEEAEV